MLKTFEISAANYAESMRDSSGTRFSVGMAFSNLGMRTFRNFHGFLSESNT